MRVTAELSTAHWRKSSYSGGQQGAECIEVCSDFPCLTPVRDSKDVSGSVLMLSRAAWQPFINSIKDGSL
ncbi:DUF397 domain-containing protein [Streptomyces prasinus]|uniref:DUF397 domain-containing protein n=1 Tax=Streptomyces prasinus TaxID=67345 RepID=UPI002F420A66